MTALVSPRPSASVAIAAAVKPGEFLGRPKRDADVLQQVFERRSALLVTALFLTDSTDRT